MKRTNKAAHNLPLDSRLLASRPLASSSRARTQSRTTADDSPTRRERLYESLVRGRRRAATVGTLVLAAVMGYHVVFGANGVNAYQNKRHETKILQQAIEERKVENARLEDHIDRLRSDPSAIEQAARVRLHYTRPDEIIVTVAAPAPR